MAAHGYALDRRLSSRRYSVMRHANGDKLIVTRKPNRHWVYANAHDSRDRGTVVDFLGLRERLSLGQIRQELRRWVGGGSAVATARLSLPELVPSSADVQHVVAAWERAAPVTGDCAYLITERCLPWTTLADPVFAGRLRVDARGNALFAHYGDDGLSGFEIKGPRGFTGFATGGVKQLFVSRPRPDDHTLIVCETAIDALSVAALEGTSRKRFVSVAGQVSPAQLALLCRVAGKMPAGSRVLLAMDNDQGGRRLAEAIGESLQPVATDGRTVTPYLPERSGEDWNDVLRRGRLAALVPPTPS